MSKYRIYELAKEFNTESKVIIDILTRNNMEAKNHMSSVGDDAKNMITKTFAHKLNTAAPGTTENTITQPAQTQQPIQPARPMENNASQQRPLNNQPQNSGQNQPRPFYNNNNQPQNPGQNQPRPFYNNNNQPQNPGQNQPRPFYNNNQPQNPGQNQQRPFYNNNQPQKLQLIL